MSSDSTESSNVGIAGDESDPSRRRFLRAAGGAGVVGLSGLPGAAAGEQPSTQSTGDHLTLVDNDESQGVILHWSGDDESVAAFAASELQGYIAEMSGVDVPVREVSVTSPSEVNNAASGLVVLTGGEADRYRPSRGQGGSKLPVGWVKSVDEALADAESDSFAVRTESQRMTLAGSTHRGTLYSAYEFLERQGIRFFAPEFVFYEDNAEHVPSRSTVAAESLSLLEEPDMDYRRKYVETGCSHTDQNVPELIDWMAKTRHNVLVYPYDYINIGEVKYDTWRDQLVPELRKRGITAEVGGHGFESFLDPDEHEEEHPTWFVDGHNVFDIANDEAVQAYVDEVVGYLEERPEIGIFDAWPPDGSRWPDRVIDEFGSIANAYAHLLNELNAAVENELSQDVKIEAIAYNEHIDPPSSAYMYDDDVIVDFAPSTRSYGEPISSDINRNEELANLIKEWNEAFDGDLGTYEYYRRYAWHSLPSVMADLIAQDVPYYDSIGMNGLGIYSEPADWITYELTHLLVAALAWDTDLDADVYVDEYLRERFQSAAGDMKQYFELTEDAGRTLFTEKFFDYDSPETVSHVRDNYVQLPDILSTAGDKVDDESAAGFLLERLRWNAEFAIADTEISYYADVAEPQKEYEARERALELIEAHRFTGTILEVRWNLNRISSRSFGRDAGWMYEMYRYEWGSLESKPDLPDVPLPDTPATGENRLNNWIETGQVIDETMVDVGFPEHHPKSPSGFYHDGTYYVACQVRNGYNYDQVDGEIVLLASSSPEEGFTQVSQVTDVPGTWTYGPSIVVDDTDELWVTYAKRKENPRRNDLHARHQSIEDIGTDPSDWTDEGTIITDARESGLVRADDGTYHCFYTDESDRSNVVVSRQESTDLVDWSNEVENVYDEANNQAPDVIPKADSTGYWLTTTAYDGSWSAVAGEGTGLRDEEFEGEYLLAAPGELNDIRKSWFSDDTTRFDYVRQNTGTDVVSRGDGILAFFEGGDGDQWSVGYAVSKDRKSPDPVPGSIPDRYSTFRAENANFGSDDGNIIINSTAEDIRDELDRYDAVYLTDGLESNDTAILKVISQEYSDEWAKAGIVVRNDITGIGESAGYVTLEVTPGNGFMMEWDSDNDGYVDRNTHDIHHGETAYPCWLKLERDGTNYTGSYSIDGSNWTELGSVDVTSANEAQDVGMFGTSNAFQSRKEFSGFTVETR